MRVRDINELENKKHSELIKAGTQQVIEEIIFLISKKNSYDNSLYSIGNNRSKIALITFNAREEYLNNNQILGSSFYQVKYQSNDNISLQMDSGKDFRSSLSEEMRFFNYIKTFQIIRFDGNSINKDLKRLKDEKFELDLVPFLSPNFSVDDFMCNYKLCKPLIERVLNGVFAYPRQYAIFIGGCFNKILAEYTEKSENISFVLTSKNKPNQKFVAQFTRITLNFKNKRIIAGIAESFFDENLDEIMIEKYGRETVSIINRGLLLSNPQWNNSRIR
ncbi:MAG: hypothetical protein HXX16_07925 [Bacteroidales bacterium]|nr:hypothetical protein [Bacteroidales bacterium]